MTLQDKINRVVKLIQEDNYYNSASYDESNRTLIYSIPEADREGRVIIKSERDWKQFYKSWGAKSEKEMLYPYKKC